MEEHVYHQLYELEDRHWWFRGRREVLWALLERAGLPARPRVLDAGCGTGRNLVEFGHLGPAAGVDPSPSAVGFCRERGLDGVVQAGLEALPFESGSFELILATDVLEHIEDDEAAARELRRVAAPSARLLVTVPAYMWLWSQHDDTHHHVRRYTARRLRGVLERAGWRPIVRTYFNSILLPPIAAVRVLARRSAHDGERSDYELTNPALGAALAAPMRLEAKAIRRGVWFPAGVSIGMVCTPA